MKVSGPRPNEVPFFLVDLFVFVFSPKIFTIKKYTSALASLDIQIKRANCNKANASFLCKYLSTLTITYESYMPTFLCFVGMVVIYIKRHGSTQRMLAVDWATVGKLTFLFGWLLVRNNRQQSFLC